jgi:hypothetical protein
MRKHSFVVRNPFLYGFMRKHSFVVKTTSKKGIFTENDPQVILGNQQPKPQ